MGEKNKNKFTEKVSGYGRRTWTFGFMCGSTKHNNTSYCRRAIGFWQSKYRGSKFVGGTSLD